MCTLDAERISTRQLIHTCISANAYVHVYVVSRFRKVIIVTLNFLGVMFKNGNFYKYDDQVCEALMCMCIPSYSEWAELKHHSAVMSEVLCTWCSDYLVTLYIHFLLMLTYTGWRKQEGMRKTNFHPESNPGLMTSKPAHQTLSHDHQTKVCPLIPSYNCSGRCLTSNLTLQTTQIMCRQNPVRNRPVTPSHQSRSHDEWIYAGQLLKYLSWPGKDVCYKREWGDKLVWWLWLSVWCAGLLVIRPGFDSGRRFVFLIPSCFLRPV